MDIEKLNEAANANVRAYPHQHRYYTFKQGAYWLLSRPLSERISKEESMWIRGYYDNQGFNPIVRDAVDAVLRTIFGTDLFTNHK